MKIGIVATFGKSEATKNELIEVTNKSPKYLQDAYSSKDNGAKKRGQRKKGVKGVPYDIAIGYYIMDKFNKKPTKGERVEVNFITPDKLSVAAFAKNDINFMMIYDILEAMNLTDDGKIITKNQQNNYAAAKKLANVLSKVDNVFPPYDYQKLINSKCAYYDYLNKKKIPISPTMCVPTTLVSQTVFVKNMMTAIKKLKLNGTFYTKPDGGQESIGGRRWSRGTDKDNIWGRSQGESFFKNQAELEQKLGVYYKDVGSKFDSIIIQKFQPGFDEIGDDDTGFNDKSPENRTYFVGGEYQYTMTTDYFCFRQPKVDGGQTKFIGGKKGFCEETRAKKAGLKNACYLATHERACRGPQVSRETLKRTKALGVRTMRAMPKIKIQGIELPRLLTRVDIGIVAKKYTPKGKKQTIFVNEVEFVPSLFHKYVRTKKIYEKLGQQMHIITALFNKKKATKGKK
uniref:Uncharacterized protein n=1 Tax=viral metagenome TaxID=1070528 RepID=A0A6C0K9A1_9ZZZZ